MKLLDVFKNNEVILSFLFFVLVESMGHLFNFYDAPNYDVITHFAGGVFATFFVYHYSKLNKIRLTNLILVLIVLGIASLWEISEFIALTFFNLNIFTSFADSLKDLLVGLIASLATLYDINNKK